MSHNPDLGPKALWRKPWGFLRLEGAMPKLRMLFIGNRELNQIARAIARARARPPYSYRDLGPSAMVVGDSPISTLENKKGQKLFPGVPVSIPLGYRASISFEIQPLGLCRHLAISVDEHGKLPHQTAIEQIARAFGIPEITNAWLEEFAPGHFCVNIVVLEKVAGHA